jgi:hypothetical protein
MPFLVLTYQHFQYFLFKFKYLRSSSINKNILVRLPFTARLGYQMLESKVCCNKLF